MVSLFLDWWSYPPAFDDPAALPDALRFLAEGITSDPQANKFDAFRFFSYRDVLWLGAGVIGFAFGLLALTLRRAIAPGACLGMVVGSALVLAAGRGRRG